MGTPILGLVENMSYTTCPKCGERIEIFGPSQAATTARKFNIPLLGRLPLDPEISKLCDVGMVEKYSADAFVPIAKKVVASVEKNAN
jgi:hypothetical protein